MVRPNMNWLELDITYVCGMNCRNCNRMTGIAPGRPEEDMTVGQVEKLIEDSVRLRYPWQEWFLVGGEPTTHPDLDAIIERIAAYRATANPILKLTVATHGFGEYTKRRLEELATRFPFLQFLNSKKSGPVHTDFIAPCIAACDLDPAWARSHVYQGCSVSGHCGVSMNYQGFYPCAVAGAIDRIFGLNQAIPELADVSEVTTTEKYQVFCRLCGYYRPIRENSQTLLSATWRSALDRYHAFQAGYAVEVTIPGATVIGAPAGTPVDTIAANVVPSEVQVWPDPNAPQPARLEHFRR